MIVEIFITFIRSSFLIQKMQPPPTFRVLVSVIVLEVSSKRVQVHFVF